jgi:hypothetical protein
MKILQIEITGTQTSLALGASFPSPQKMRDFQKIRVTVCVCVSLSPLHIIKPSEFLTVRGGHPIPMNSGSAYISHLLIGVRCIHLL